MSRRRHHMESYEEHKNGRSTRSPPKPRSEPQSIKYQDDSLSSFESDSDICARETVRVKREPAESCSSSISKSHSDREEACKTKYDHRRDSRYSRRRSRERPPSPNYRELRRKSRCRNPERRMESPTTTERLERLEKMLEQLIGQHNTHNLPTNSHNRVTSPVEKSGTFVLEPRDNLFTTSMWLNKLQEVSVANNWDEMSTVRFMESQMTGIIKAWHNNLPNRNHFTWPEWKLLISKTFPDNTEFVTTMKRLVTRLKQSDESVTNYYFAKMYLIEACKITGPDAVSCLIDGLNNQTIQTRAKLRNFVTPETFFTQFLASLAEYEVDYMKPRVMNSEPESWYLPGQNPDSQNDHYKLENDLRQVKFDRELIVYSSPETENPPLNKRSGSVHSRLDFGYKYQGNKPYVKICTLCFKKGHLANYCRDRTMVMYLPKKDSNFETPCLMKTCIINNQFEVEGLIDTGSTVVSITHNTAAKMRLEIEQVKRKNREIVGFGGMLTSILGEIDLAVSVDGVSRNVTALVVPEESQHVPLIIGMNFLTQSHVGMLMTNGIISVFEN